VQRPLPLWTSDQIITYSELQKFCDSEYGRRSSKLLKKVRYYLERFEGAQSRNAALRVLMDLDEYALELSCFNSAWVDFSLAVFEMAIVPSRASVPWMHKYLSSIFDRTIRGLS
jgi:hypothetical protein